MANDATMKRTFEKQICIRCNARNLQKAKQCHKYGYEHPRPKSKGRHAA